MPALNDLLASFGIAFGDAILEGQVPLEPDKPYYASGANIVRFPAGGHLHGWQLADKAAEGVLHTHTCRKTKILRTDSTSLCMLCSSNFRHQWHCCAADVLRCTVRVSILLCSAVLCCAVLCCAVLCCAVLCSSLAC